jgi:arsenic resistance protein ArsH
MGRCQTQGKTLAVMQVSGGSQGFNALNQLRIVGRSMRMLTIPNQSSVPRPFLEFTEEGRMAPLACYDRIVDVMEKLFKFTLLTRDIAPYLGRPLQRAQGVGRRASNRVNQRAL